MSYPQPAFKLLRHEGSDRTYEHLNQIGRVKVQHWKANGGSTVDRVEYAYADASNATLRDIPSSLYGTDDWDQTYGYDGLHRRITKTVGSTTVTDSTRSHRVSKRSESPVGTYGYWHAVIQAETTINA